MPAEDFVPTEPQRKVLCDMTAGALVELRHVGGIDNAARAADLADVFHNVPAVIHGSNWWKPMDFRTDLQGYQRRYANDPLLPPRDYVAMFDAAFGAQLASEIRIKEYLDSLPPVLTGTWQTPNGSVGLLLRVVHSHSEAHAQHWFYGQYGPADGSQWSTAPSRFPTLEECKEDFTSTLGPGVTWDPPPSSSE